MLTRLNDSRSIVECGTSFGVSTIYFALAANSNALGRREDAHGVVTIEKDPSKLQEAKKIWVEAGPKVQEWIHPYQGDILEVLRNDEVMPKKVDAVFLDGRPSFAIVPL
jgi:predicted O-methyltransferase YrrM